MRCSNCLILTFTQLIATIINSKSLLYFQLRLITCVGPLSGLVLLRFESFSISFTGKVLTFQQTCQQMKVDEELGALESPCLRGTGRTSEHITTGTLCEKRCFKLSTSVFFLLFRRLCRR